MEIPEANDWETLLKRQRAIQGICGKTQPDFSEQRIQRMSYLASEKVRAIQKTQAEKNQTRSSEVYANDWLDSPNTTAEARLHRFDSEHPRTPNLSAKRKDSETLVHWKATSQPVALFEASLDNPGQDHPVFLCQIPNFRSETWPQEKVRRLNAKAVSAQWPLECEKIRLDAATPIRQMVDHLVSLRHSGRNFIAFCSPVPLCGCTTIVLICARETSHRGLKTLLIDGNFSHPSLVEAFQLSSELSATSGWTTLLEDENATATLWSLEDNLDLLPLEATESQSMENLFRNVCIADWTNAFRNHYDLVLMDFGSLSAQKRYSLLKRFGSDGVFLVVDNLEKSRNSLHMLQRSLAQHEIAFLGLAENHVR